MRTRRRISAIIEIQAQLRLQKVRFSDDASEMVPASLAAVAMVQNQREMRQAVHHLVSSRHRR